MSPIYQSSESDIKELQRTARYLSSTTLYQSADVFIDVYKEMSQQALVVYHKPPAKTTLYSGDVVGMEALLKMNLVFCVPCKLA